MMVHYPHMLQEDVGVWSRYLADPVAPITEVWYDVRVGAGIGVPAGADEVTRKIARAVGQKRIDCVCRVGGGYWVVEIKPLGSMLALGQAISYARLFVAEYRPDGQVWPTIVCDQADDDLLSAYDDFGVLVIATGFRET